MFKTEYVLLMSDAPFLPYAVVHSFFSIVGLAQKQFERIDIPYTVSLYIKRKERKKRWLSMYNGDVCETTTYL